MIGFSFEPQPPLTRRKYEQNMVERAYLADVLAIWATFPLSFVTLRR